MDRELLKKMLKTWESRIVELSSMIDKSSSVMKIAPEFWEPAFRMIDSYSETIESIFPNKTDKWLQWYYESILGCGHYEVPQNSPLRVVTINDQNGSHDYTIKSIDDLADLMM